MKKYIKYSIPTIFLIIICVAIELLKNLSFFSFYKSTIVYQALSEFLRKINLLFKFSIGDVFYILLSIYILFKVISKFKSEEELKIKFLNAYNFIVKGFTVFYIVFNFLWGLNYSTKNFKDLYLIDFNKEDIDKICLGKLEIINKTVNDYNENTKIEKTILLCILQDYYEKSNTYYHYPSVKSSLFKNALNHLGIGGYYNPFTGEAQYNNETLEIKKPFTIAHEVAHQIGYAKEYEASFVGYLSLKNSKDAFLEFIAEYKAFKYLLFAVGRYDFERYKIIFNQINSKVKAIWEAELKEAQKYEGIAEDVFEQMNDSFLKMNQQDGVEDYHKFTELLIRYEKQNQLKNGN